MSHPLERKIGVVRSRIRRLVMLYGLSWIVGAVLTAMVVLGGTDYLFRFQDPGIRVICSLVVLGVFGWTSYRYLFLGLTARWRDVDLARRLGRRFPALGDGLASAVEFLKQAEDDPTAGSLALRRAVVAEATAEADGYDFRGVLEHGPTLRAAVTATVIFLVAVILVAADPPASRIAMARLANPFSDVAWPQDTRLAILEGELTTESIAEDEAFEVEVIDLAGGKLPPSVRIHYRFEEADAAATEETRVMQVADSRVFAGLENVRRSFSYRIELGEETATPWVRVEVVKPSAMEALLRESGRAGRAKIPVARLANPDPEATGSPARQLALVKQEARVERVARGQAFEIEVIDARGGSLPSKVRIHYRFENPDGATTEETELMHYLDGHVHARRENVTRPFSYRVEGGDDRSMPWIPVQVVEPPAMESLVVRLIPPQYTGWPAETSDKVIRALVGTRVEITGRASRPLRSALLCLEGGRQIPCRLSGERNRDVAVDFVVERSGAYWFELVDRGGLAGGSDVRWEIRAIADGSPTVSIEQPSANMFVVPDAVVPLRMTAKDDLAIRRVDLEFTRSDRPDEAATVRGLYVRQEAIGSQDGGPSGSAESDEVRVADVWQLAELEVQPGCQLTFRGIATDYQPRSGKSEPRRLTVISREELAQRIAARHAFILAELSRVLEMQRQNRGQVTALEIRLDEVGYLNRRDVDHLRGAELNQRQVNRTLTSRSEGVPMHILGLLGDLENNKVDSPDVRRQMQELLDEIDRLEREHLPIIGREITSAIKAAQVGLESQAPDDRSAEGRAEEKEPPQPATAVATPLGTAGKHQDEVIASLERMLGQLAQWDNYRRFHRQLGQLLRDQEELARRSVELGRRTLARQLQDLAPQELADLKIQASQQFELARRLDRIQHEMELAGDQLQNSDPLAAETISDALHRARQLAVGAEMRSVGGAIRTNRMGRAIGGQKQVVQNLREILDILAGRREHELARLIAKLREAEADLADLARRQGGLKKRIDQAAETGDEEQRRVQLQRLASEQQKLEEETQRMARRLERLLAQSAGEKTRQAAEKMNQTRQSAQKGQGKKAAAEAEGAKKDLDDARRQLAQSRRQAEVELATEQMARLEDALGALQHRQQKALDETRRLDGLEQSQGRLTPAQSASLQDLAREQRLLHTETRTLTEKLVGADVFSLALSRAAGEMARAAGMLDRRRLGLKTQQAEFHALERLGQLLEALKQEEPEEDSQESGSSAGGEAGQGSGSGADALQALAELKLLKLMQEEVNRYTLALEKAYGSLDNLTDEAGSEYRELSAEQGQLADLLLGFLQPEEDPENQPPRLPDVRPEEDNDPLLPFFEEGLP